MGHPVHLDGVDPGKITAAARGASGDYTARVGVYQGYQDQVAVIPNSAELVPGVSRGPSHRRRSP